MSSIFLQLEVKLLIAKYGYRQVLSALAEIKDSSVEEIEATLQQLLSKTPVKKTEPAKSFLEIAEDVIKGHENYTLLRDLAVRYNNKRFLPQLKDVKGLLKRCKVDVKNIKSRGQATKLLFEVFCTFSTTELKNILPTDDVGGKSAFSALAKEIIEGSSRKRDTTTTPKAGEDENVEE